MMAGNDEVEVLEKIQDDIALFPEHPTFNNWTEALETINSAFHVHADITQVFVSVEAPTLPVAA